VQKYIKANNSNPIDVIKNDLDRVWNNEEQKEICFPIFLRIGRILK
jgi:hypothetical protein